MSKIVKNASDGYGYKYSNLADLAKNNINIPKMRVKPTEFGEFIEYWDGENWQIGAKIVLFEAKGMNAAQMYGAALTYARRYTVQMAESVACDDDDAVEKAKPVVRAKSDSAKLTSNMGPSPKQKAWLLKYYMEKSAMGEEEAQAEVAKFKTANEASTEIGRLIEEDKNGRD